MPDTFFQSTPDESYGVVIEIAPVEDEKEDLVTLAAVGQVQAEIQQEVAHHEGYTVRTLSSSVTGQGERGFDTIVLITLIGASITTYKDLLTSIFNMVSAVIELLAKRGRVQEIEIITDGKMLVLRDVSKKTAKELIEALEAQHPAATAKLTPGAAVRVKAKVSKKGRHR